MIERQPLLRTCLDAKTDTGWGTEINVADFRHVMVAISTASSADATVKVAGSFLKSENVDFTSAAAVDNEWDYIYSYNLQSASGVAGDTGVVYSGTDAVEQLIVNIDGIQTLNLQISAISAGAVTAKVFTVSNQ